MVFGEQVFTKLGNQNPIKKKARQLPGLSFICRTNQSAIG